MSFFKSSSAWLDLIERRQPDGKRVVGARENDKGRGVEKDGECQQQYDGEWALMKKKRSFGWERESRSRRIEAKEDSWEEQEEEMEQAFYWRISWEGGRTKIHLCSSVLSYIPTQKPKTNLQGTIARTMKKEAQNDKTTHKISSQF